MLTTLYWDLLWRHEVWLRNDPRITIQLKSLDRLTSAHGIAIDDIHEATPTLKRERITGRSRMRKPRRFRLRHWR